MSKYEVPRLQQERIEDYLAEGMRFDGRSPKDWREFVVEKGISTNAESSVSVKLGKTHVMCGVKMAVTTPYPDSPDEGTFMTTAELHPMASDNFDIGRPGIQAIELGRVIDRGIRESGLLDFKKLVIKSGEKVWQVFVDIIAINDDGNLFDAAGLAALIALGQARLPIYNEAEDKLEHELSDTPLPLNKDALSFNITFHRIGDTIIVDPSKDEEAISSARLSIAIADNNGEPRITAMQKGKAGILNSEDLKKILETVKSQYKDTFPKVLDMIWN
ncbi:MAG: exosome complex component RRP42 [Patescibacteria group bacterium]|jgi:exosome complex component RRP42